MYLAGGIALYIIMIILNLDKGKLKIVFKILFIIFTLLLIISIISYILLSKNVLSLYNIYLFILSIVGLRTSLQLFSGNFEVIEEGQKWVGKNILLVSNSLIIFFILLIFLFFKFPHFFVRNDIKLNDKINNQKVITQKKEEADILIKKYLKECDILFRKNEKGIIENKENIDTRLTGLKKCYKFKISLEFNDNKKILLFFLKDPASSLRDKKQMEKFIDKNNDYIRQLIYVANQIIKKEIELLEFLKSINYNINNKGIIFEGKKDNLFFEIKIKEINLLNKEMEELNKKILEKIN
jgi:hypothetical protein